MDHLNTEISFIGKQGTWLVRYTGGLGSALIYLNGDLFHTFGSYRGISNKAKHPNKTNAEDLIKAAKKAKKKLK